MSAASPVSAKFVVPISFVIPTKDRAERLAKTLRSLSEQSAVPKEVVVVDASELLFDLSHRNARGSDWFDDFVCTKAVQLGAAVQRNQGVQLAKMPFIAFCDDDIDFEPDCVKHLWEAIQSDDQLGGVNAMIVNQRYQPPGTISRTLFTLLHGRREQSFAGRVIGPAVNLLPEDRENLPAVVPVEWLNLGATIYRREALPSPPFDSVFTGYSMMEDLTLSLRVAKKWRLANARTARVFHDSQSGTHKDDISVMAAMELTNRHYIMTRILEHTKPVDYLRLFLWEAFQLAAFTVRRPTLRTVWAMFRGKINGFRCAIRSVPTASNGR